MRMTIYVGGIRVYEMEIHFLSDKAYGDFVCIIRTRIITVFVEHLCVFAGFRNLSRSGIEWHGVALNGRKLG